MKCQGTEVEPPTLAFSELTHPVFPTASTAAVGLPDTGKYEENARTVVIAVGDFNAGAFADSLS
jgi:hypothetical protein